MIRNKKMPLIGLIVLILSGTSIFAQSVNSKLFFLSGMNVSYPVFSKIENEEIKDKSQFGKSGYGYNLQVGVQFDMRSRFAYQGGLGLESSRMTYELDGFNFNFELDNRKFIREFELNQLNIFNGVKIELNPSSKYYLKGIVNLSYLFKITTQDGFNTLPAIIYDHEDISQDIERITGGINLILGREITFKKFKNSGFLVELGIGYGFLSDKLLILGHALRSPNNNLDKLTTTLSIGYYIGT